MRPFDLFAVFRVFTPRPAVGAEGVIPDGDYLLLESGDYLLLESGDYLLLEDDD